jgi:hypothetical protein
MQPLSRRRLLAGRKAENWQVPFVGITTGVSGREYEVGSILYFQSQLPENGSTMVKKTNTELKH